MFKKRMGRSMCIMLRMQITTYITHHGKLKPNEGTVDIQRYGGP